MKNSVTIVLVALFSQFVFAENKEYQISEKCLNKLAQFSSHFALANMMNYGNIPVSIGKITVNPTAVTVGESGFGYL